jgi:sulfide:quinone oxidoreductase
MKRLVVLGAGTAGTMIVNKLEKRLPAWDIVVVEPSPQHVYQPGLLFVPFGKADEADLVRATHPLLPERVTLIQSEVDLVVPDENIVRLESGEVIAYDQLVIATGTRPRPDQTEGMVGPGWRKSVHEFYTLEGAVELRRAIEAWDGGDLVVHITEMPIKCPVAPLEFAFLADDYFAEKGIRDRTRITYVTPLSGAFTKPIAAERLGSMLDDRGIALEPDFYVERVDGSELVSFDDRRIPFDLLVTVPLNMGADFVARSGLGDELNHVRVDQHTFLATGYDDIWAVGDAANLPTSKAGSSAHFGGEVFVDNFLEHVAGEPMTRSYDGHANCFVESGNGKAMLIDFNYETEPLPGTYPLPRVGPFRLLAESRLNHLGKLAFRTTYWNLLLPGRRIPVPNAMSMAGKRVPKPKREE